MMKKLFSVLTFLLFSQLTLFATTPYNLEGIKALNVLVLDQNAILTPDFETKLRAGLKQRLDDNGIVSKKDGVGAMFIKIAATKVGKISVIHITLGIGEESIISRGSQVKSFALTYSYDDMIETENVEADVYDSVLNFLIEEFLEQFHEDNEE